MCIRDRIKGGIDRLERLEVNVDFTFLSFGSDNFTAVDHKTIWRDPGVQLQALLGRRNGRQNG